MVFPVVYASKLTRSETDDATGETSERDIPFLKAYTVFNVEQIDGLPAHYTARQDATPNAAARVETAEHFFAATGADIRNGGDRAFYAPGPDFIQIPDFAAFTDAESYYATLGHECVHWTRHASRLDRDFIQKRFGDEAYAPPISHREIETLKHPARKRAGGNLSPSWARRSSARTSGSHARIATTTRPISRTGCKR